MILAAEIIEDNEHLKTLSAEQQQQLAAVNTELQLLQTGSEHAQFRDGALAVIAGMLLALGIRRLWPKKRSEWT